MDHHKWQWTSSNSVKGATWSHSTDPEKTKLIRGQPVIEDRFICLFCGAKGGSSRAPVEEPILPSLTASHSGWIIPSCHGVMMRKLASFFGFIGSIDEQIQEIVEDVMES
jgi:hypothetical protein